MQGRFNLNNLINDAGEANERQIERFERLLENVGANRRWARMAADWLDIDTVAGFPDGAEDGNYLSQNPPYLAANGPVTTTTELMALPGMTLEEFQRIQPYVAALPLGTQINICTAIGAGARGPGRGRNRLRRRRFAGGEPQERLFSDRGRRAGAANERGGKTGAAARSFPKLRTGSAP